MARRRLGVALLIDAPVADEVDGLRRALDDRALTRIPPHLTLISPVNVREDDLGTVLCLLRDAAASSSGPLELILGPPATFLPDNPVLYLAVAGDVPALAQMRSILFAEPLARALTWPWVPHVTLADDADPGRIAAGLIALAGYTVTATFDRVVLLEERHGTNGRRWAPLADTVIGPRVVVGRGGLPLELTVGRVPDPEALALLRRAWPADGDDASGDGIAGWDGLRAAGDGDLTDGRARRAPLPIICVARREGAVVGVGGAWESSGRPYLGVLVDAVHRGQGIGTHVLAHIESVLVRAAWSGPGFETLGPTSFYRGRALGLPGPG